MAGKSAASAPELEGNRESSFLDNILRRLESSSDLEAASNSMGAFDASVLSPNSSANPWQYLSTSNPASPTLQRDFYNLMHSIDAPENPWTTELEQQRVPLLQTDDVSQKGGARATLLQRRREQRNPATDSATEVAGANPGQFSEAMFYEELAAAWYRSGYLRGSSVSPRDEGLQGMWEGLLQAYASEEKWGNPSGNQNGDPASVNQQFDPNMKSFDLMDTRDEAAPWQRPMPSLEVGGQFVESSTSEAADMDTRSGLSLPVGGNSTRSSSDCRVSPNTSLSSGSGGYDSDDEECARNVDQNSVLDSGGKRKTPEASEELEEKDDPAKHSSETTDLKKTAPSETPNRPRKKKNTKRSREPRYAIKTRTDVDIMDDGFKWRKYGQKAVKNSPHPRNYYRCTTPQCPVRKRVERASEDAGLVITTYEGTHTHHAPGSIPPHRERPPHATSPLGPPGLGFGFGFRGSNLLPLPPEFTTLAALHQMRSLQQILAHQQLHMPTPTLPRSLQQRESLLRAQQFLELHDYHQDVKPQPLHPSFLHNQFTGWPGFPYRQANLQTNFMRAQHQQQQQQQRHPPQDAAQADADLVRRVLEADEFGGNADFREENEDPPVEVSTNPGDFVTQIQNGLRNQVAMEARRRAALLQRAATVPRGSATGSRSRGTVMGEGLPRRPVPRPREDELVDGLLQEMAKRGESSGSR